MDHPAGWYPAPNGQPMLWYWDGWGWHDPLHELGEVIRPQLEEMFIAGAKHGWQMAVEAMKQQRREQLVQQLDQFQAA